MSSIKYSFNSNNFDGKVVLITGSSSGIGEETAIHFVRLGANVVICGRDQQKVSSVAEKCRQILTTNRVLEVLVDFKNENSIKHLVDKTVQTFGKIDVLVNSAGAITQALIDDSDYCKSFDEIMRINLKSVVYLTSLVVPHLEVTKGCIVYVCSITSQIPRRSWSAYGMSKCGIDMLTKCLAMELGSKGIRVNAINPGIVITPMLQTLKDMTFNAEELQMFCQMTYPLGREGRVEDMAQAIAFLASDNSSFITGLTMPVDGGCVISRRSRL